MADECFACGEDSPRNECKASKKPCGHHCNCSWVHDYCHWCRTEFGENGTETKKDGG